MWTVALYSCRGDKGSPESLWSAERVHFDVDEGVELWNDNDETVISDFADYDIDIKNKIILIYKAEETKKLIENEGINW